MYGVTHLATASGIEIGERVCEYCGYAYPVGQLRGVISFDALETWEKQNEPPKSVRRIKIFDDSEIGNQAVVCNMCAQDIPEEGKKKVIKKKKLLSYNADKEYQRMVQRMHDRDTTNPIDAIKTRVAIDELKLKGTAGSDDVYRRIEEGMRLMDEEPDATAVVSIPDLLRTKYKELSKNPPSVSTTKPKKKTVSLANMPTMIDDVIAPPSQQSIHMVWASKNHELENNQYAPDAVARIPRSNARSEPSQKQQSSTTNTSFLIDGKKAKSAEPKAQTTAESESRKSPAPAKKLVKVRKQNNVIGNGVGGKASKHIYTLDHGKLVDKGKKIYSSPGGGGGSEGQEGGDQQQRHDKDKGEDISKIRQKLRSNIDKGKQVLELQEQVYPKEEHKKALKQKKQRQPKDRAPLLLMVQDKQNSTKDLIQLKEVEVSVPTRKKASFVESIRTEAGGGKGGGGGSSTGMPHQQKQSDGHSPTHSKSVSILMQGMNAHMNPHRDDFGGAGNLDEYTFTDASNNQSQVSHPPAAAVAAPLSSDTATAAAAEEKAEITAKIAAIEEEIAESRADLKIAKGDERLLIRQQIIADTARLTALEARKDRVVNQGNNSSVNKYNNNNTQSSPSKQLHVTANVGFHIPPVAASRDDGDEEYADDYEKEENDNGFGGAGSLEDYGFTNDEATKAAAAREVQVERDSDREAAIFSPPSATAAAASASATDGGESEGTKKKKKKKKKGGVGFAQSVEDQQQQQQSPAAASVHSDASTHHSHHISPLQARIKTPVSSFKSPHFDQTDASVNHHHEDPDPVYISPPAVRKARVATPVSSQSKDTNDYADEDDAQELDYAMDADDDHHHRKNSEGDGDADDDVDDGKGKGPDGEKQEAAGAGMGGGGVREEYTLHFLGGETLDVVEEYSADKVLDCTMDNYEWPDLDEETSANTALDECKNDVFTPPPSKQERNRQCYGDRNEPQISPLVPVLVPPAIVSPVQQQQHHHHHHFPVRHHDEEEEQNKDYMEDEYPSEDDVDDDIDDDDDDDDYQGPDQIHTTRMVKTDPLSPSPTKMAHSNHSPPPLHGSPPSQKMQLHAKNIGKKHIVSKKSVNYMSVSTPLVDSASLPSKKGASGLSGGGNGASKMNVVSEGKGGKTSRASQDALKKANGGGGGSMTMLSAGEQQQQQQQPSSSTSQSPDVGTKKKKIAHQMNSNVKVKQLENVYISPTAAATASGQAHLPDHHRRHHDPSSHLYQAKKREPLPAVVVVATEKTNNKNHKEHVKRRSFDGKEAPTKAKAVQNHEPQVSNNNNDEKVDDHHHSTRGLLADSTSKWSSSSSSSTAAAPPAASASPGAAPSSHRSQKHVHIQEEEEEGNAIVSSKYDHDTHHEVKRSLATDDSGSVDKGEEHNTGVQREGTNTAGLLKGGDSKWVPASVEKDEENDDDCENEYGDAGIHHGHVEHEVEADDDDDDDPAAAAAARNEDVNAVIEDYSSSSSSGNKKDDAAAAAVALPTHGLIADDGEEEEEEYRDEDFQSGENACLQTVNVSTAVEDIADVDDDDDDKDSDSNTGVKVDAPRLDTNPAHEYNSLPKKQSGVFSSTAATPTAIDPDAEESNDSTGSTVSPLLAQQLEWNDDDMQNRGKDAPSAHGYKPSSSSSSSVLSHEPCAVLDSSSLYMAAAMEDSAKSTATIQGDTEEDAENSSNPDTQQALAPSALAAAAADVAGCAMDIDMAEDGGGGGDEEDEYADDEYLEEEEEEEKEENNHDRNIENKSSKSHIAIHSPRTNLRNSSVKEGGRSNNQEEEEEEELQHTEQEDEDDVGDDSFEDEDFEDEKATVDQFDNSAYELKSSQSSSSQQQQQPSAAPAASYSPAAIVAVEKGVNDAVLAVVDDGDKNEEDLYDVDFE